MERVGPRSRMRAAPLTTQVMRLLDQNTVVPLHSDKFRQRVGEPDANGCRRWLSNRDELGYGYFQFRHNGEKCKVRAHRAALIVAGHNVPPCAVVRHLCNNPWCVEPAHLAAGTTEENVADRVAAGRSATGEHNGRAVMREGDVLELRRAAASFVREWAERCGVDNSVVRAALRQKTWRNVGS